MKKNHCTKLLLTGLWILAGLSPVFADPLRLLKFDPPGPGAYYYKEGDPIHLRLEGERQFVSYTISKIKPNTFEIEHRHDVDMRYITGIKVFPRKSGKVQTVLLTVGSVLSSTMLSGVFLNNPKQKRNLLLGAGTTGGAILGSGTILKLLDRIGVRYAVTPQCPIRVVDFKY